MEERAYKSVDGIELLADLHTPANPNGTTIVLVHGGGLVAGTRKEIPEALIGWFTARGYRVALPDYRLAPETRLPAILDDIRDAWEWCARQPGVDPGRMVLMGQSAGAYLSHTLAEALAPTPRALVSVYGYGRIDGAWSNQIHGTRITLPRAGPWRKALLSSRIPKAWQPRARIYYSGVIRYTGLWTREVLEHGFDVTDRQKLRAFNPEERVTSRFPRTIFVHGEADTDVPSSESVRMSNALRRAGVEHELIVVPRRGHGFDVENPGDPVVVDCLERVDAFLRAPRGDRAGADAG